MNCELAALLEVGRDEFRACGARSKFIATNFYLMAFTQNSSRSILRRLHQLPQFQKKR